MQIKEKSIDILFEIRNLLEALSDREFSLFLPLLSGNSIGKHVRHILEFYDLMLKSPQKGEVCYDDREHNHTLEEERTSAISFIDGLIHKIQEINQDEPIELIASYKLTERTNDRFAVSSTLYREMIYNIEHAIHHMALIRLALREVFPHVEVPKTFGIASSTSRYQSSQKN